MLTVKEIEITVRDKYGVSIQDATAWQLHNVISEAAMANIATTWKATANQQYAARRAMYLSMEFLVGRSIQNNLLCLGLDGEITALLKDAGVDYGVFEEIEDAALGNGGLGRLAACFLDSAAMHELPLFGYGIRYQYGLFKQKIVDGFQSEEADDWARYGDPWSVRAAADSTTINYGDGEKVLAVPYDMPVIGWGGKYIGTLRLWQAESAADFDFAAFERGEYLEADKARILAESISKCLYPNDNTPEGKVLRLKQEAFFSYASVHDAVRRHIAAGREILDFAKWHSIQLNDTHPILAIPALIGELMDNHGVPFEAALAIAKKTFNYTNHTIMAEALEKWDIETVKRVLPQAYEICLQIHETFLGELYRGKANKALMNRVKIIADDQLHMARLGTYCGAAVNGVAEIHTEILKNDVLKDWYHLYPEKFQNKTNGITPRRWLRLANPELSAQITQLLGDESWVTDLDQLKGLRKFADDASVINAFIDIKKQKKRQLAAYVKQNDGAAINPDWIFDVQIKRLHEYKRQLLNALSILYIYFGIKDGSIQDFYPTAFIFGAKSAPGYARAKGIIKFLNEVAHLVSNDPETKDRLQVVFASNYRVSYAEKLAPAADVSEQISTAGTEASGTGNMKLMLNGAVTLGTYDGANVEIVREAGEENNYIFGARVEDIAGIADTYDPRTILSNSPKIARVLNTLIDGTVSDGGSDVFRELYFAITDGTSWHNPDQYYLLLDFQDYVDAKLRLNADYRDNNHDFYKKCWLNVAGSGFFSSDRTIIDYAENIWKI
ncbi:alpha-1,4 glucan phosphorylase [Bacteroidia bacterium]|nr:alpha-1,4 glucan phosphorylase [Bacteroidia bacterium]